MQANFGRAAGDVINREDIKPQRNVFDMALSQKSLCGARYDVFLV
jgi:hypothetical protein